MHASLTLEFLTRRHVGQGGTYGGQSGNGKTFCPLLQFFLVGTVPSMLHTHFHLSTAIVSRPALRFTQPI
jgi:hypothetical protein